MKTRNTIILASIVALSVVAIGLTTLKLQSEEHERYIQALLVNSSGHKGFNKLGEESIRENLETAKRGRAFYNIWVQRNERNVAPELAVYLQDKDEELRDQAVKALGRLETDYMKEQAAASSTQITLPARNRIEPPVALRKIMAARVDKKTSEEKDKLEAMAQSVGLTMQDIPQLSKRLQMYLPSYIDSPAEVLTDEMVDVLYTVKKRGKNISALKQKFALTQYQKLKLDFASSNPDEEAERIVQYFLKSKVLKHGDEKLIHHLAGLKPYAMDKVFQEIKSIAASPEKYKDGRGYVALFRAADLMGDKRVIPFLKKVEAQRGWMEHYAEQSIGVLESGDMYPRIY